MSIRAIFVTFVSTCLLFSTPAMGKVIHVPADQPTIQAGINAAANGDTVLVSAGTYYENINFNGKAITVTSASGPAATVIDGSTGQSYTAAVTFTTHETLSAIISGFTIQNGENGDIYIYSATPTVTGNIITNTKSSYGYYGSGVNVYFGGGLVQGNLITATGVGVSAEVDSGIQVVGNLITAANTGVGFSSAEGNEVVQQNSIIGNTGEGIYYYPAEGSAKIIQNLVEGNESYGLYLQPGNTPISIISNTITNNQSSNCCGYASELDIYPLNSSITLQNNLIVATQDATSAMTCNYAGTPGAFTNNDIYSAQGSAYGSGCPDQTGVNGNISADPSFADFLSSNFHLRSDSPAIKAGTVPMNPLPTGTAIRGSWTGP